jgi:adenylate kinase
VNLVFIGPPGSGKGTQSIKLAASRSLVHLSTGDLLRQAIKDQSEIGKKADEYMSRGELVPDSLIIGLIEEMVKSGKLSDGFILDGFPRTIPQAEALKKMFANNDICLDKAILLEVSEDEVISRLKGRAEKERRSDDTDEVVKHRLEVYQNQTEPIIEFYRNESILEKVQGEGSMDEVFDSLMALTG